METAESEILETAKSETLETAESETLETADSETHRNGRQRHTGDSQDRHTAAAKKRVQFPNPPPTRPHTRARTHKATKPKKSGREFPKPGTTPNQY